MPFKIIFSVSRSLTTHQLICITEVNNYKEQRRHLKNSYNIGRHALFSYRAQYEIIECSNCHTEERSEAELF